MGGRRDTKERDLNYEHPFPMVSGYKKRIAIEEVDITELRVYDIIYMCTLRYNMRV